MEIRACDGIKLLNKMQRSKILVARHLTCQNLVLQFTDVAYGGVVGYDY